MFEALNIIKEHERFSKFQNFLSLKDLFQKKGEIIAVAIWT